MPPSLTQKMVHHFPKLLGQHTPWHIRLNVAFGLIASLVIISAVLSSYQLIRYGQLVERTIEQALPALEAAKELSEHSALLSAGLPALNHARTLDELEGVDTTLNTHRQQISSRLEQLKHWLPSQQLLQIQDQVEQMGDSFTQLIKLHAYRLKLEHKQDQNRKHLRDVRTAILDATAPLIYGTASLNQLFSRRVARRLKSEQLNLTFSTAKLHESLNHLARDLAELCFTPQADSTHALKSDLSQTPRKKIAQHIQQLRFFSEQLPELVDLLNMDLQGSLQDPKWPCHNQEQMPVLDVLNRLHHAQQSSAKLLIGHNRAIAQQLPKKIQALMQTTTKQLKLAMNIKADSNQLNNMLAAALFTQNMNELLPLNTTTHQTYAHFRNAVTQFKKVPLAERNPILKAKIIEILDYFQLIIEGETAIFPIQRKQLANQQGIKQNIEVNHRVARLLSTRVAKLVTDVKQGVEERRHTIGQSLPTQLWLLALTTAGSLVVVTLIALVTSRLLRRHQQQLTESEKRLRIVVENMPVLLLALDKQGHIVVWNSECERVTGFSESEVIGQPDILSKLYPDPQQQEWVATTFTQNSNNFRNVEITLTSKDGQQHTIAWSSIHRSYPIPGWEAWAVGVDVTERNTLEHELLLHRDHLDSLVHSRTQALEQAMRDLAQKSSENERLNEDLAERVEVEVEKNRTKDALLIHQSRLAAMGEMIGNIAHQWRQPLSAVNLMLFNIKDLHSFGELSPERLYEKVERASHLLQSMSHTIDDFRNFFKPDKVKERFDLKQTVEHALSLVHSAMENHQIEMRFTPPTQPVEILGYPRELSQVILLILNNAKDAIVEAGQEKGVISLNLTQSDSEAILEVQDNGTGIPDEILDRIFDPYFTTKDDNKGTGIGLYMGRMIVMEHMQGLIEAKNQAAGASFSIRIPLAEPNNGNE
ncbi:ATP-binding protein [Magnetococcus sp. PR-3]|uniref:ATP-binding protein n=1 Tax=Magnetococcus sp. PR-3 TaxID=3120355 RepID=UPI002FCE3278